MSSRRASRRLRAATDRRRLLQMVFYAVAAVLVVLAAVVALLVLPREDTPAGGPSAEGSTSAAPSSSPSSSAPSEWPVATAAPREAGVAPGDGAFLDPAAVDRADPDAVAEAVAMLFASHDTLLDGSEADSRERARELLDPVLLEGPAAENPSPGASWLEAQKHDAYTQPLVTPLVVPALGHSHEGETEEEHAEHEGRVGQPTETAEGEAALGYEFDVLYHWQGRDEWVSDPEEGQKRVVRLSLVERDGVWVAAEAFYGHPVGY